MSRSQQYLESLLSGVPLEELSAFEHRSTFQQLKERLSGAQDIAGELKALYRVNNFSDFALQLLWIAQRTEQDPSMLEPTPEEQTLVLSAFRHAIGDTGIEVEEQTVVESTEVTEQTVVSEPAVEQSSEFSAEEETVVADPFTMTSEPEPSAETPAASDPFAMEATTEAPPSADPFGIPAEPEPTSGFGPAEESTPASSFDFPTDTSSESAPEPMADFPSAEPTSEPAMDFPSGESSPPPAAQPASQVGEGSPETQFATLVERFAEALQTGAADRDTIKDEMLNACSAVLADGSGAPDDHKNFCRVLTEFTAYIYDNQFVDDIRVMNLLSNVPDPVWAWARADDASRAGMMDAAYDTLREFKSLFE